MFEKINLYPIYSELINDKDYFTELRKKFESDEESKKFKFLDNKLDKKDENSEKSTRRVPKHSKSNNFENLNGFQRRLSMSNSDDDAKLADEESKPVRTARRMQTNIFSKELLTSMKVFNQLNLFLLEKRRLVKIMDFLKEEQQFYQNKSTNVLTKTDQKSNLTQCLSLRPTAISPQKQTLLNLTFNDQTKKQKFLSNKSKSRDCNLDINNSKRRASKQDNVLNNSLNILNSSRLSSLSEESISESENRDFNQVNLTTERSTFMPKANSALELTIKPNQDQSNNLNVTTPNSCQGAGNLDTNRCNSNKSSNSMKKKQELPRILAQSNSPFTKQCGNQKNLQQKCRVMSPPVVVKQPLCNLEIKSSVLRHEKRIDKLTRNVSPLKCIKGFESKRRKIKDLSTTHTTSHSNCINLQVQPCIVENKQNLMKIFMKMYNDPNQRMMLPMFMRFKLKRFKNRFLRLRFNRNNAGYAKSL